MDGKFIDFPLCCLAYIKGEKQRLTEIALFCVIEKALKLEKDKIIFARISNTDFSFMTAIDFVPDDPFHQKIGIASQDLGISISNILEANSVWVTIKEFVISYEAKYKKDAYCRMGRQLTFETIEGKFPYRDYSVLCAISSILGKSRINPYLIPDKRIAYCMHGYKTEKIASIENPDIELLSDKQLDKIVKRLKGKSGKSFIGYVKMPRKGKYYSTRIKETDKLREAIKQKRERRQNSTND